MHKIAQNFLQKSQLFVKGNSLNKYYLYNFGTIKTFILPDLGEKIKEATVKEWHVKVGEQVEEFQTLADVSTDKLFTQIPSSYTGKIHKLFYSEEDIALVGEPFLEIEVEDEHNHDDDAPSSASQQEQVASEQKSGSVDSKSSSSQASQQQQQVRGKALATPATRGLAKQLNVDIDIIVGTGPEGRVTDADIHNFVNASHESGPAVRALSQEYGIDVSQVKGTGKDGRVTKSDILDYIKQQEHKKEEPKAKPSATQAAAPAKKPAPVTSASLGSSFETQTVKMSSFAQGMQKSMTVSNQIPTLYIKEEIDITEMDSFRKQLKKSGVNVAFMSIFVKAFSLALNDFPIINSTYDESKPFEYNIVKNHNITVAIASPHGLVVPNIKNVQNLNIVEIQEQIKILREKADQGKLGGDDLFNGSVSISNIGTIGGTYAGPLVFAPQTSIVAIGRMQELPRYVDGQLVPRKIIYVSLGCDHRVIDGANAAGFVMKWRNYLENPVQMLAHMK